MNLALRETWRGRVWRIAPTRLVEERDDDLLLLWSPPGTPVLRPFADGRQLRVPGDADWRLEPRLTSTTELGLVRPGGRWSIWLQWDDGDFSHWYVNFKRDHVRSGGLIDLVDEKLDLVVAADGTVGWKDEDELELAGAAGLLDPAVVRAEAERLVASPPWPTGFEDWRPDPAWPAPELPEGWDVV